MKRSELTVFQLGALTHFELQKKAKKEPAFVGFLDPKVFAATLGWHQTKKKRGYTEEQAEQFLAGFAASEAMRKSDAALPIPGNPSLPRYYHRVTGMVEHITGTGIWHRNRAKGRMKRRLKAAGIPESEMEYRAGMGPGLLGRVL